VNLGPNLRTKDGYHVYYPDTGLVLTTRNLAFDELWRARAEFYQNMHNSHPTLSPFPPGQICPPAPIAPAIAGGHGNPVYHQQVVIEDQVPQHAPHGPVPVQGPVPVPHHPATPPPPPVATPAQHHPPPPTATPNPVARTLNPVFDNVTNPIIADGPNTNHDNSRHIPVTPANDSHEVATVRLSNKVSAHSSAGPRYNTEWAPSYNMTSAAIEARTTLDGLDVPYKVARKTPSVYNPANFDVEWVPSLEPASTFLQENGDYLDIFKEMDQDSRAARVQRRSARIQASEEARKAGQPAPVAFFMACVFSLFVAPCCKPDSYYSSPYTFTDSSHTRFHSLPSAALYTHTVSPTETYNNLLKSVSTDEIYAFLTIALPSGSTPKTIDQALTSVDARHWRFALDAEYSQLVDALAWDLVDRKEAENVISGKWVFKIKRNADGTIDRYKARWVARGFTQRQDVDYTEIFAPVIRYSSLRTLAALSNANGLRLFALDVSNAFARADVDERVYVEQPHGFVQPHPNGPAQVCQLRKGLYGTKQAARLWNQKFRKFLLSHGWRQLESDPCIYSRKTHTHGWEMIGLYVDDILHCCTHSTGHDALLSACRKEFPTTSQGEVSWILGMHIKRDFANKTLSIDQTQAIKSYIEECNIPPETKIFSTPMDDCWKYGNEPPTQDSDMESLYRSQCGSIMYFAQCTRPDIAFAIGRLCCHLNNPNASCFKALNRLNAYISSTANLGIEYNFRDENSLRLEVYADASWGSDQKYKSRSQSGYVVYLGGGPVDWKSKMQATVAASSAESEYISTFHSCRNIVYFRELLKELEITQTGSTIIWQDNKACIAMSKNAGVNHNNNKHILLKYHYIRELAESDIIRLEYIETIDQIADILTKATAPQVFRKLVPFLVRPCGSL